jgi:hypothetical protein
MKSKLLIATSALGLATSSSQAVVLYSQPFSAASAQLNGTAVAGGTLSSNWKASGLFMTNGTLSATTRSMALLSFTPSSGNIYELSMTVGNLSSGFLGIGFCDDISFTAGNTAGGNTTGNNNTDRMINGNAINYGMMFLNPSALATTGMGYSTYSSSINILDTNVSLGAGTINDPGPYNIKILMDTTGANWTTEYFVDNVSVRFFTHAGALTNIDSVGINAGNATTATTFSNFQLQTIPEPGASLLGGVGILALLRRRRS